MSVVIEVPGHGPVEFPDGMSDDEMAAAIRKNFMIAAPEKPKVEMKRPMTRDEETKALAEKAMSQGWGTGIPAFAKEMGGKATDLAAKLGLTPEAAGGVGVTANVLTQAIPALASSFSLAGKVPVSMLTKSTGLPRWLMQTAVKPSTDDLLSGAAKPALTTMLDEGITPTMGGMTKAAKITQKLDDQVSKAIAGSQAKIPVGAVASRLDDTLNTAGMQVNPKSDMAAVENAWTEFLVNPHIAGKKEIPVQLAHELKRGTYKALGGKSYGEMGSTSVEAQKALARGLREETMKAVPSIEEPLARQAALMNVRDVAGARALQEANKNPAGLAALRVDHPLSGASFLADRWAWLKAMIALGLHRGTYPQALAPMGVTGTLASQPNEEKGILYP
jgi:hypothetical protein